MNFNNLHLHTTNGSFLDSMVKIKDLIPVLKKYKHTHCAITDHGSLAGIYQFKAECDKNDIIPILGCEFYEAQGSHLDKNGEIYHLILLAMNKTGLNNLIQLNNIANKDGKYKAKPRIDFALLSKYSEGLICGSACMSGRLSKTILQYGNSADIVDRVYDIVKMYKGIFNDNYYLEIQDNGIPEQELINEVLISVGEKYNIPVIMTNDTHYLYESDSASHDILKRIHYNKKEFSGFSGKGYHLKRESEFSEKYSKYLDTTFVTSKIEKYDIEYENHMPLLPDASKILNTKTKNRLSELGLADNKKYVERLNYELDVINSMDYASYFLIVSDFIDYARANKILVGVGRGSAGGSLVAYLSGITGFDPVDDRCKLYFERFLNPDRISIPDIDVDVNDRDKIIEYLKEKYGNDKVLHIGTLMTLGIKDVLRNVARVCSIHESVIKPLLELIPIDTSNLTNKILFDTVDEYRHLILNNETLKMIYEHAVKIEGSYKNPSLHASGIIISNNNINLPISEYKDLTFTQCDMHDVENLGYVKFDILGLKTLNIIQKTINKIKDNHNIDINITKLNYWDVDEKTMQLVNNRKTKCVFQWESDGYKSLIHRLKPDNFNELIDLNTLYRPGCLESGLTDKYINRKFMKEEVTHIHEDLKDVLTRYGLPLFQEEIMLLCNKLAGFTLSESDIIRKAIGKKDKDLLSEQKDRFISGCISHKNINDNKAHEIWEMIEKFGRYSWNLSHGVAYTIISYWTAYLSANYPVEFFAANLEEAGDFERIVSIINEIKNRNIEVCRPDVNKSGKNIQIKDGKIYLSFNIIKGISDNTSDAILNERNKGGMFVSFDNFTNRVPKIKCNKLAKESLILSGAFDNLECSGNIMNRYRLLETNKTENLDYTILSIVKKEYTKIGMYFDETPISILKLKIFEPNVMVCELVSVHLHVDRNGKKMAFLSVTDYTNTYSFVVFSAQYSEYSNMLNVGNIIAIKYDIGKSGFIVQELSVIIDKNTDTINMSNMVPVVSSENSNLFTASRFIYEKNDEILYIRYIDGDNTSIPIKYVEGYRRV